MKRICVAAAKVVTAGIVIISAAAPSRSEPATGATPQLAVLHANQPNTPEILSLGPVEVELKATSGAGLYTDGASAFAQLTLSSQTRAKNGIEVEVDLQAEHGEIVDITGSGVKSEREGVVHRAFVAGIRKGHERTLLVEIKLHKAEGNVRNRLTLTIRMPDPEDGPAANLPKHAAIQEKTVTLEWPVADCAGQYYSALRQIGDNGGKQLRDLWRNATRPDKSMPRGWLFRPSVPPRSSRRRSEPETDSVSSRQARAIYLEARRLMGAGYDTSLRESGEFGWMIGKVAGDLKNYFSQDMNPAICTGADGFAAYYERKLSPLQEHGERLAKLADNAGRLARQKTEIVLAAARDLPGGHPGWGGASLASLKPLSEGQGDWKLLLVDLLQAVNFPEETVGRMKAAKNGYQALAILDDAGLNKDGVPKSLRDELRTALAAIEAALRLDTFRDRQETLFHGFEGSLDAIREAHRKHCLCNS